MWWNQYLRDTGGTGFWHETYFRRGGFEAIYDNMPGPIGFLKCAPALPTREPMCTAGERLRLTGSPPLSPAYREPDLYGEDRDRS